MLQLTYIKAQHLEWQEALTPTLTGPSQALVKPMAVARCDLDFYIAMGQYRIPGPFPIGHEMAGIVTDVGDEVTSIEPGDRVIVPFQINCGACNNCRRGWTNACSAVPPCSAYGLGPGFGGGFSDYINVPYADAMLVKIPDTLSMAAACGCSDNVADGFRTVEPLLKQFPQEPILIVGGLAKSVGLYAAATALACGASRVVYVDDDRKRLDQAQRLGAEVHSIDFTAYEQFDETFLITVDANCTPAGMAFAINTTAACGYCTSVSGGLTPTTSLPLANAYLKGIHYQVSRVHSRATLPLVLQHVCHHTIDPLAFAEKPFAMHEAHEAIFQSGSKLIFTREEVSHENHS